MHLKIDLNDAKIKQKVTSDKFGLFVSHEWKRLINRFTPRKTGLLIQTAKERPWEIEYIQPYSAYMYYGKVFVDPQTGASGFLTDEGWKSRKGVKKIPSNRTFKYNKDLSPNATDHWDEVAARSGELNKLYRTLNAGLQSGRF